MLFLVIHYYCFRSYPTKHLILQSMVTHSCVFNHLYLKHWIEKYCPITNFPISEVSFCSKCLVIQHSFPASSCLQYFLWPLSCVPSPSPPLPLTSRRQQPRLPHPSLPFLLCPPRLSCNSSWCVPRCTHSHSIAALGRCVIWSRTGQWRNILLEQPNICSCRLSQWVVPLLPPLVAALCFLRPACMRGSVAFLPGEGPGLTLSSVCLQPNAQLITGTDGISSCQCFSFPEIISSQWSEES